MANQSVKEFYTRFILKIDAIPQDVVFQIDINENFSTPRVPIWESYWYQKGSKSPQGRQLKPITRENRGSCWPEMRPQKQKIK